MSINSLVRATLETIFVFIILFLTCIFVYAVFDYFDKTVSIEQQAIEKGYALYCPKDGKFAWKGECNE